MHASHAAGADQEFDIRGTFGPGRHSVGLRFLNGLNDGTPATDRTLYVDNASLDGVAIAGGTLSFPNQGSQGFSFAGATTVVQPPPQTVTIGTGTDVVALQVTEDAYQGDAQFTVAVDGTQIGGTQTAQVSQSSGGSQEFDVKGSFGAGPHTVTVNFLNDLYGGSSSADRNLYVGSATYDGASVPSSSLSLKSAGPQSFNIPGTGTAGGGTAGGSSSSDPTGIVAGKPMQLLGVNIDGAEYNQDKPGATLNQDYVYPAHSEIDYFSSIGMNVIRVPLSWTRMQPSQYGALDQQQLNSLDDVVSYAASKGVKVELDNHNYGWWNVAGGQGGDASTAIGVPGGVPSSALADFWTKMATHYINSPNVLYGLMNESVVQTAAQWAPVDQDSINAIRATGATQEILVPGVNYTTAETWNTGSGNAAIVGKVTDPGHNMAFEVHMYLDANNSGEVPGVASTTIGPERLDNVTQWAQSVGARVFLGEFGVGTDATSLTALDNTMAYLQQHSNVWQGGTYYGAGPWMSDYRNAGPDTNQPGMAPQTAILAKYVPSHA